MFDPKKWIEKSWNDDDSKTVRIAGEDVRIRRLKGTQWEQYVRAANGKSEDSAIVVVLQYGLVKAFGQHGLPKKVLYFSVIIAYCRYYLTLYIRTESHFQISN